MTAGTFDRVQGVRDDAEASEVGTEEEPTPREDGSPGATLQMQLQAAEQRARDAELRAQAAELRAEELASLEARVQVAERRALDAERRLFELTEQVESVQGRAHAPDLDPPEDDGAADVYEGAVGQPNDLRARLARTAARKKPGGSLEDA